MSSQDSNIKQLVVTGDAANHFLQKGSGTRKRRSSARKNNETRHAVHQEGGTSPGTLVALAASRGPITANAPIVKASNAANASLSTDSAPATTTTPTIITKEVSGGASGVEQKPVKVVLAGGKKKTNVILSPNKIKKTPIITTMNPIQGKTRKIAKKIRMSLGGFGKRVTRANHIRHQAKKQSVEELKKTLIEAKLIKSDSKAPETVLRQMYADYMMLKNRAL